MTYQTVTTTLLPHSTGNPTNYYMTSYSMKFVPKPPDPITGKQWESIKPLTDECCIKIADKVETCPQPIKANCCSITILGAMGFVFMCGGLASLPIENESSQYCFAVTATTWGIATLTAARNYFCYNCRWK